MSQQSSSQPYAAETLRQRTLHRWIDIDQPQTQIVLIIAIEPSGDVQRTAMASI
jgi:hypothetical protein